ncbi:MULTISPECIES: RagB/SusD family nutrient uptake outer membrane protein [unclassified Sphingobacterium]|uniref:RagB/SusD family nutrient uptake outer membrane protein n=1 Tax=unclassified Sphingobacterium TaxID=2609468 RepID=UPI00104A227A|nr:MULTISPECIES: RagB/SusD family nutrient uptake outer membrane protein [unclassified Sphingobacterium]MCS3554240.1 hypothetical protein [Sphingobacterium sp. JUb21]TCR08073.1 putative outer membrane starch-binding protein [Sphingobacterium sp. JUb20]
MKNKHIVVLGTLLTLSFLTACKKEDFLDRSPQTSFTENTYFKTETDLKLYTNQFYGTLPVEFSWNDNASTDNLVPNNRSTLLAGTLTVPASGGGWATGDWASIRACNFFLIRNVDPGISDALKNKYNAEVRFFRAMFYWQKVVTFGAVPIYKTDLNETSPELMNGRNSHKEVMDFVLEDLDYAIANLGEPANDNRINKYVAQALKSRICLWEGTFRKYHALGDEEKFLKAAADASLAIINSNKYLIYNTGNPEADYRNIFLQTDLSNNKESILSRIYITNLNTTNYTRSLSEAGTGFSKDFARSFLCKDGLPFALSPLYAGDDTPENESKNRDPRYKQTIGTPGFVLTQNTNGSQIVLERPNINSAATSTGYQIIKGRSSDPAMFNANQETIDRFIFRYAEVLLNYAEAKAELGELDQSIIDMTIKPLRDRAGMPNINLNAIVGDPNTNYPDISLHLQEIRRERRIELAGDGFRFNDLLRWKAGKLLENRYTILGMKLTDAYKAKYPASQGVDNLPRTVDGYIRVYSNIEKWSWNDKNYLNPLPIDQLTLNPNLKPQNTGW